MSISFEPVEPMYSDFLRDESRKTGRADAIGFPVSEDDVREALAQARQRSCAVTIQGGRTGITAGAVPDGGWVLNLGRMKRVVGLRRDPASGSFFLSVQPGVLLTDLRTAVAKNEFDTDGWTSASRAALEELKAAPRVFFPPDPTETTASIGGMVSCNASGACTFRYGPTRKYVSGLRVVLADGSLLELRRGEHRATGREFGVGTIHGRLPRYTMPAVKNASGYFAADSMDLVDLFVGAEGTLGVVTEAELELIPAPRCAWGVVAFLPDEASALRFVRQIRETAVRPVAIEYFDGRALDLLRAKKPVYSVLAEIPDIPPAFHTGVYVEYHGDSEDALAGAVGILCGVMAACGGDENATWTATSPQEMERLHAFRHAVPETVNLVIDERRRGAPGLTKLGTDMAVPDEHLERVMELYRGALDASGLEYVIFGHIGNNHVHVNILPRSIGEYERGRELYLEWAKAVIRMGGTVSAEHGVGKMKVALLREMYGEAGICEMRAVKRAFDPEWRLNRGNLFDPEP